MHLNHYKCYVKSLISWPIPNSEWTAKIIDYVGKRMLRAAQNYSKTELELCGLALNVASCSHLL